MISEACLCQVYDYPPFNPLTLSRPRLTFSACLSVAAVRPVKLSILNCNIWLILCFYQIQAPWSLKPFQVKRFTLTKVSTFEPGLPQFKGRNLIELYVEYFIYCDSTDFNCSHDSTSPDTHSGLCLNYSGNPVMNYLV